jgi:DNA-binding NarL/FixJ family response regulator
MKDNAPIRVLCIDDHPLILAGVEAMLNAEPGIVFAGGASSGEEGIRLFREQLPDVTLVDLRLNGMSGTATIAAITGEFSHARLIALTTYKGDASIHQALAAGARGYILKDLMHHELVDAIHKVHGGGRWIAAEAAARLAENAPRVELTPRELDVLRLIAAGNRNKEIAGTLDVTEDTIKFHVKSILAKLGVNDRTHAVTVAVKRGILHLD